MAMPDKWLVLGGWCLTPNILKSVFGETSVYIDINELVPEVVCHASIAENWQDIFVARLFPLCACDIQGIAGWSTGAIIASTLARKLNQKKMVLLSATASFCRRDGFKFGQRQQTVHAMREGLQVSSNTVLEDFIRRCEIPQDANVMFTKNTEVLDAGLCFLEQCNVIDDIKKNDVPTMVFHGNRDVIVPVNAGKYTSDLLKARFFELPGGHAFFMQHCAAIASMLSSF